MEKFQRWPAPGGVWIYASHGVLHRLDPFTIESQGCVCVWNYEYWQSTGIPDKQKAEKDGIHKSEGTNEDLLWLTTPLREFYDYNVFTFTKNILEDKSFMKIRDRVNEDVGDLLLLDNVPQVEAIQV